MPSGDAATSRVRHAQASRTGHKEKLKVGRPTKLLLPYTFMSEDCRFRSPIAEEREIACDTPCTAPGQANARGQSVLSRAGATRGHPPPTKMEVQTSVWQFSGPVVSSSSTAPWAHDKLSDTYNCHRRRSPGGSRQTLRHTNPRKSGDLPPSLPR